MRLRGWDSALPYGDTAPVRGRRGFEAPGVGLEPTTSRLTGERILPIELPRIGLPRNDTRALSILPHVSNACLNLGVAVAAQQHTLFDLIASLSN